MTIPVRPNRAEERIPLTGRIHAFDALRSFAIFMVVVTHTSMTYAPHTWSDWFVVSEKSSYAFWFIVHVLDICLMPALFFAAGYFTTTSYLKKGFGGFMTDKVKHILLPWLLGIFIVPPLALLLSVDRPVEKLVGMFTENPLGIFSLQGHLWFLGMLFVFFLAYALWARFVPPDGERRSPPRWKNISALVLCVAVSCALSCVTVESISDYYRWIRPEWMPLCIRPVKVASYVCFFLLGIYGWRAKWFTAGGWMPGIGLWRVMALASFAGYFLLYHTIVTRDCPPPLTSVLLPVADTLAAFASTFYIVLAAIRRQKSALARRLADLSVYSFGFYWIHEAPMFFYLRLVNESDVPIFFKWFFGIAVTCLVSWLLCKYILKRAPLLREMF